MSAKSITSLCLAIISFAILTHCSGPTATNPEATVKYTPDGRVDPAYKTSHPGCCEPGKTDSKASENERGLRAAMGAASLLSAARNPETLHFTSVLMMKDGTVRYMYRAQNGFGGFNREFAVLPPNPKVKNLSQSTASWNARCANKEGDDYTALINSRMALLNHLAGN